MRKYQSQEEYTMTAKGTTKQGILDAALELFSVQGYEATSISQLAEAVGIRKASLYSHFENKQAILDALIQTTIGEYEKHSILPMQIGMIPHSQRIRNI